jgi:hypothetical protein
MVSWRHAVERRQIGVQKHLVATDQRITRSTRSTGMPTCAGPSTLSPSARARTSCKNTAAKGCGMAPPSAIRCRSAATWKHRAAGGGAWAAPRAGARGVRTGWGPAPPRGALRRSTALHRRSPAHDRCARATAPSRLREKHRNRATRRSIGHHTHRAPEPVPDGEGGVRPAEPGNNNFLVLDNFSSHPQAMSIPLRAPEARRLIRRLLDDGRFVSPGGLLSRLQHHGTAPSGSGGASQLQAWSARALRAFCPKGAAPNGHVGFGAPESCASAPRVLSALSAGAHSPKSSPRSVADS